MPETRRSGSATATALSFAIALAFVVGAGVFIGRSDISPRSPGAEISSPALAAPSEAISVTALIEGRENGHLPAGKLTVKGYWSGIASAFGCQAPADTKPIELACVDGQYGLTDDDETLMYRTLDGWQLRDLVHVTPYIRNQELALRALFTDLPNADQNMAARETVVIGHFDDIESDGCPAARRAACRDRFVLDDILSMESPTFVELDRSGQAPNKDAEFDPSHCQGDVPYDFQGWTTLRELGVEDRYPDDVVYGMRTSGSVPLGDWVDGDPEERRPYRFVGRQLCFSRSYKAGIVELKPIGEVLRRFEDGSTEAYEPPLVELEGDE